MSERPVRDGISSYWQLLNTNSALCPLVFRVSA